MSEIVKKNIVIMAGGTGGHIFPGLAVAELLKKEGYNVFWLGAKGLETTLVPKADIVLTSLSIKGLRGNGLKGWLAIPFNLTRAVIESYQYLKQVKPVCVVGFGGFASAPGGIAARLLKIPLVIHEQNAIAGLSNRLLSRLSQKTLSGFPCGLKNSQVVGNPVRGVMLSAKAPVDRYYAREDIPLNILILGGSQGANYLNRTIPEVARLIKKPVCFWHQTGEQLLKRATKAWQENELTPFKIEPFIDDMLAAYEWADIVICRSGALTLAELTAVGVASILVPFPHAVDDHQTANAHYLYEQKGALLLQESALNPEKLTNIIEGLTREQCLAMAINAQKVAKPEAAKMIVDECRLLIENKD